LFSILMPYFERPTQLKVSLLGMEALYARGSFEVVIVDDGSRDGFKPEVPEKLSFDVKIVTLKEKSGINPSVPYNVGASVSDGDFLVLTSPEIVPVLDVLSEARRILSQSTSRAGSSYVLFDVFALTHAEILDEVMRLSEEPLQIEKVHQSLRNLLSLEKLFEEAGPDLQKPWSNSLGAWYQHHKLKASDLNFLAIIPKVKYFEAGGFCEQYRKGTGYDDLDFRDRIRRKLKLVRNPGLAAVHLHHEEVSTRPDIKLSINSNRNRYWVKRVFRLGPHAESHNFDIELMPGN
jgi:glycosyltransferase involved in cell wall biosynthesis